MKRKIILVLALCTALTTVQAQQDMAQVLQSIEANNPLLLAAQQETDALKWENRSRNTLNDPRVSYAHVWGPNHRLGSELVISQSFDFPSLYAGRAKLNRLQNEVLNQRYHAVRQELLLQAQTLCLDIIGARQELELLQTRAKQAEELSEAYRERLSNGDASMLDINKMNLEVLNVQTQLRLAHTNLQNKIHELEALNGSQPVAFEQNIYPVWKWEDNIADLTADYLTGLPAWQAAEQEAEMQQKKMRIEQQGWIPRLELGYKRNSENRRGMNGLVVGFSIPIFENRSKVKVVKAQALSINYRKESLRAEAIATVTQDFEEARTLRASMEAYEKAFQTQNDVEMLSDALEGGQISLTDYFTETALFYQSKSTYLQLKNRYFKALAKLYRYRL